MPRTARLARPNQYYHIYNRGANNQNIFKNRKDYLFFLDKLNQTLQKYDWQIYTYCLLPNHYHLQIKTKKNKLGTIIQSLQTSHAIYFNHKYKHLGPVFQNRYHSVTIQDGEYFLYLSKYIHLNPVKAELVKHPQDYPYSSYNAYLNPKNNSILDTRSIRTIIGKQTSKNIQKYQQFVEAQKESNQKLIYSTKNIKHNIFGSSKFSSRFV